MGDVLSFPGGDVTHGGDPLLSGTRYIIAVFLLLEAGEEDGVGEGEGDLAGNTERGLPVVPGMQGVPGVQRAEAVRADTGGMSVNNNEEEMVTSVRDGEELEGEGQRQVQEERQDKEEDEAEGERHSIMQNGGVRYDSAGEKEEEKEEEEEESAASLDAEQMVRFIGSYLSLYTLDDSFSLPPPPSISPSLTHSLPPSLSHSTSLPTQPQITEDLSLLPINKIEPKLKPSICNTVPEKKELFSFCFDSFD